MTVSKGEMERRMKCARELVAQAWCEPETEKTQMDAVLAEAFARILMKEMFKPHLNCASNAQLMQELASRMDLSYRPLQDMLPGEPFHHEDCSCASCSADRRKDADRAFKRRQAEIRSEMGLT